MSEVTITTVQGIGDIFWCYQKLAPFYDWIHFNVLTIDNACPVQTRAKEFLTLLPKYSGHEFTQVAREDYHRIATLRPQLPIEGPWFEYAVNNWLEGGTSLYEIDDEPVLKFVQLRSVPETDLRISTIVVFVAGMKGNQEAGLWSPHQWAEVAKRMMQRFKAAQFDFVGAAWDKDSAEAVIEILERDGLRCQNLCGHLNLAESTYIIRTGKAFLGYQSGLNVLAENYDVPQLMVYFDRLEPMMHTWKKPGSKSFHATTFGSFDSVGEVIAAM